MQMVALKIQRRRSPRTALNEIGILKAVARHGSCPYIVALREAFLFEGHVCMAYERHGRSLEDEIESRPLTMRQALRLTEQMLSALEHLHAAGFTHTDLKPANILYDRKRGVAKLADLGNAEQRLDTGSTLCTRDYTPPEVLLGAPLTPRIDHWSLGCTLYEMLTGEALFNPRAAAAEKYQEFYFEDEDTDEEMPAAVAADEAEEEAEQYASQSVIAGKYRLEQELGRGRFGTVWSAEVISSHPLDGSFETLWQHCQMFEASRQERSAAERRDRAWQRSKGADDLRDLALNYEHLLLVDRLIGPLPASLIRSGTFRTSFFTADGKFRHSDTSEPVSIRSLLKQHAPQLSAPEIRKCSSFIRQLCDLNPAKRTGSQ